MKIIIALALVTFFFWLCFRVAGALLATAVWLFIKLPIALVFGYLGVGLCVTILLIPLGIKCIKFSFAILT